ncbi:MAG: SusC/RagA family TonB-linked outer membrane protein [Flavobacteriaceae bacterium]|nr:SusC/RagA family TonB-linked outer membrane protein [Flavobacteriaceae bacterium]
MKCKFYALCFFFVMLTGITLYAQERTISGTVKDDTGPLPGVSILIKGTTKGAETDFDGNYSISAKTGDILVFSFVGMATQEITVGTSNTINVLMKTDNILEEVVVTALGVSREKKSLGYAAQEVKGDEVSTVKLDNVVNSLSGKVSGVQIKANNNFGGSANFLIRGVSSLTGDNQPLFVVDGIPISNRLNNTRGQQRGSTGYDYGNAASDINPDDVESINILKGAAAAAVYGSRGANGVVIITTKSDKKGKKAKVAISSGITVGSIDRDTFLKYQNEYGAGYGPYYGSTGYFEDFDVNGDGLDDLVVPTYEDASYGAPLDGTPVYQWDSFVPESSNYLKAYPYIAGKHTPADFFETTFQTNNSLSVTGGTDNTTYRLGYTNFQTTGMLPNSELTKNIVNLNATLNVTDKFKVGSSANVVLQRTKGRNSTGYSDNLMTTFRQWWEVNVDIYSQRDIFEQTGKNYSWNNTAALFHDPSYVLTPIYWDNPYWTRYKNYETDNRNRFYGNFWGTYSLTSWLDFTAKAAVDTYSELREERRAVGSVAAPFGVPNADEVRANEGSGYDRTEITFSEYNYDFMLNFNANLSEKLSLAGVAGINIRREKYDLWHGSTNGGLANPEIYSLGNSALPLTLPQEILTQKQVNGHYIQASFGYDNLLYLELTDRYDISTALPPDHNDYNYYGISSSLVFSSLVDAPWLNFGKLRAGYAEVGNDLPANNVYDSYDVIDHFGSVPLSSYNRTKKNENLVPERSKEIEVGLESRMFKNRVGLDLTWYKRNTENQLMPVSTTAATGFTSKWVNAGEIQNKGIEVGLNLNPIKTDNFSWDITVNWAKNKNLVVSLYQDVENIVLQDFQGGVSINATKGQPYGTIRGTGFVFDNNGNKVVSSSGYYLAQADQIIGDVNPDWTGGVTNTFKYKNLTLGFLIDVQQGGDVYSLDIHYGQGTGLPYYTAGLNELGNPVRDPVSAGGGILNPGVTEDGQPNTTRARADSYAGAFYWGNSSRNPSSLTVFDASYIKLRELSLTYNMPSKWFKDRLSNVSLSLVGRNLWIIDKNVPFADPESGLGAGNVQGYLSGSYPTLRTVGLTLNMEF